MIRPENELDSILHQLRDEHRSIEAPASVEGDLVRQIQQAHPYNTGWFRCHAWGLSFALLALAVVAGWLVVHARVPPAQPVEEVQTTALPTAQANVRQTARSPHTSRRPSAQTSRRRTALLAQRHQQPDSSVDPNTFTTRFVRLPTSEGLPESVQPSFVRMRILTSSLPQYGIDVPPFAPPQFVLAEFVVGEDGLPRAIRLIR